MCQSIIDTQRHTTTLKVQPVVTDITAFRSTVNVHFLYITLKSLKLHYMD